jgi:hypothetical protein
VKALGLLGLAGRGFAKKRKTKQVAALDSHTGTRPCAGLLLLGFREDAAH